MKVMHVITRLDRYGSALDTLVSVDRLRNHGIETALAYGPTLDPDGSIAAGIKRMGVPSFNLRYLTRNISPFSDLAALHELRDLFRRSGADMVHTHTSKAGTIGRLAARMARLPVVHTPHGHIFYGYFGPFLTRFFVLVERYAAGMTDRIVSLTDLETKESLERGIGRPEQYVTIHSGVPLEKFGRRDDQKAREFRESSGIPRDSLLFVSVGRLTSIKGHDMLLDAFARAGFDNPVSLMIVGDGEEKDNLSAQAERLGISGRVRFTGALPDVRGPLWAADAFVLMSRNEGMGRVIIEAMAAGLPVVGPAVGGVPTVIDDGKTGLLVPGGDVDAMATAMKRLVDPDLRRRLGAAAAVSVYPEYDESTMISRLAVLYEEVAKGRST